VVAEKELDALEDEEQETEEANNGVALSTLPSGVKSSVVLLQLTVLAIFLTPRGLKGMAKHCIFEHFLRFANQIPTLNRQL
jgi:hypothetical protein